MLCVNNFHQQAKSFQRKLGVSKRKFRIKSIQISFSQAEAMTFFKKGNELLRDIGLDKMPYSILSHYLTNIGVFVDELPDADPIRFTRDYFEIQSRIMMGFPSFLIFGTRMITAFMKQLVLCDGFYIGKALGACKYVGKGLSGRTDQMAYWKQNTRMPNRVTFYSVVGKLVQLANWNTRQKFLTTTVYL